jgi:hypothetical protein
MQAGRHISIQTLCAVLPVNATFRYLEITLPSESDNSVVVSFSGLLFPR